MSRPIELLVLKSCVTDTKLTPRFSMRTLKPAASELAWLNLSLWFVYLVSVLLKILNFGLCRAR